MAAPPKHEPMHADDFRPITPRRRVLIVVLALGTAGMVMYSVLERPGLHLTRPKPVEPAPCAPGQQTGCVGGQSEVIVVLPPAPQSAVLPNVETR